jgi:hypothetical protein
VYPVKDGRNSAERVFAAVERNDSISTYEISVVFSDEDQPFFLWDWFYDGYRRLHYKRKKDIETFTVICDRKDSVVAVDLRDVYSGTQDLRTGIVKHYDTAFSFPATGTLTLYVNTWNHLFGLCDNNPGLEKNTFEMKQAVLRSRKNLELMFRK